MIDLKELLKFTVPLPILILAVMVPVSAQAEEIQKPALVEATEPASEGVSDPKEAVQAKPTVANLQKLYGAGQYHDVIKLVKHMTPSPMTHYYTGLAYQALNQNYRAAVEYNYVSQIAQDKQLRANASKALKSLYQIKRKIKPRVDKFGNEIEFARYGENVNPGPSSRDNGDAFYKALERQKRVSDPQRDRYGRHVEFR